MKESEFLHVSDPVWWRGGFGDDEPKIAEVEEIEYHCVPFDKKGIQTERLPWRKVKCLEPVQDHDEELIPAVVILTNGYWACGWQLWPLKIWTKTYVEEK